MPRVRKTFIKNKHKRFVRLTSEILSFDESLQKYVARHVIAHGVLACQKYWAQQFFTEVEAIINRTAILGRDIIHVLFYDLLIVDNITPISPRQVALKEILHRYQVFLLNPPDATALQEHLLQIGSAGVQARANRLAL